MPLLETTLLIKGLIALAKAGPVILAKTAPVIWTKLAAYATTHTLTATVTMMGGLAVVVGGVAWTHEKFEALKNFKISLQKKDPVEIVKNAVSLSAVFDAAGGIESIAETRAIFDKVISTGGRDACINRKAAARCGTLITEISKEINKSDSKVESMR